MSSESSVENVAMLMACESRPTMAVPAPSETPAVISGSTMAAKEPNTRNSTIAAARNPNNRPLPELLVLPASAMLPSTWNCTPLPECRGDRLDELPAPAGR